MIHLYHRGLPLALINEDGKTDRSAEYDAWGNVLSENNPHNLEQHLRLPGQQYDEETGLHYNRHHYYDPRQGRYITQDPIGLIGGWNAYVYPLDPVNDIDPLGLWAFAIPAILEGINWLFWGSATAGGAVLATSGV
jgi:RHS repeat-associated protein